MGEPKVESRAPWRGKWCAVVDAKSEVVKILDTEVCRHHEHREDCPACKALDLDIDPMNELWDECELLESSVAALTQQLAEARAALLLCHDWLGHVMQHGPDAEAPDLTTDTNIELIALAIDAARSSAQAAQPGRDRQPDEYVPAPEGKKSLFPDEDAAYRKAQAAQPEGETNG